MKFSSALDKDGVGCWRRIGVAGDRSCPELSLHAHCRHCPIYADAAQHTLRRPLSDEYRDNLARDLGRAESALLVAGESAVSFRVGSEWLALPMALVSGVAPLAPIHSLPHRPRGALLGIVNVGGRLLPAVSPARLLNQASETEEARPPRGRHAFARLLVAAAGGHRFALQVEEIHGVLRYSRAAVRAPAATVSRTPAALLVGVIGDGDLQAGLLDAAPLAARLQGLLR